MHPLLIKSPAAIVTVNSDNVGFKRGNDMKNVAPLSGHSVVVESGLIADIIPDSSIKNLTNYQILNAENQTLLPGLIECHTHTAFAGSRAEEFRLKLNGVTYEEIALMGGGIKTTVKAVRNSSPDQLVSLINNRVRYFISQGITTLEIKSGYGLDYDNELKLLQAINLVKQQNPIDIIPTFLGAHTFPPEFKQHPEKYIDLICGKMLPDFANQQLAPYCDAFCESTAFSAAQVNQIFTEAARYNYKLRLHTDQFNSIGGIDVALNHNALSVDHLEVLPESIIPKLAASDTVSVLLPGVSLFLNYSFAPARKLIESNAIVALSTDYNPGSSHIPNIHLIMSLAALKMRMTIEETISAVTINAAKALGLSSTVGSIEIGKKADFALFNSPDYSDIIYTPGINLLSKTIKNGNIIYSASKL